MRYSLLDSRRHEVLLVVRVFLVVLFVLFGWAKITGFSGTVGYMASLGAPLPIVGAAIAVIMELGVGIAIALGFYTRPLALILALYTLATALIGHHFWNMTGAAAMSNEINFFKNISIMGGLFLLCLTGPGRYSLDRK